MQERKTTTASRTTRHFSWIWFAFVATALGTPAGLAGEPPVVTGWQVVDNGDGDGWADTLETVELTLTLLNRGDSVLGPVALRLTTEDPRIACVQQPVVVLETLAAGEERRLSEPFVFQVADVERDDVLAPFSAVFTLSVESPGGALLAPGQSLVLPLDLDGTSGGMPTEFLEGFETGAGAFEPSHLDVDLNAPDGDLLNDAAGRINSDGYRCRYHDPDIYFCGFDCNRPTCHLGPRGAPDAFYFQVTEDRAFNGTAALYWGVDLGPGLGFTTPTAQLEAMRTGDPIHLAWEGRCDASATPCSTAADCPAAEACELPEPVLSFKHQIDLALAGRLTASSVYGALDRAVVQVQLSHSDGTPAGRWVTIAPFVNDYESTPTMEFTNCTFDPIDDASTEDDLFYPDSPFPSTGPSSTCAPQAVFAYQGATEGP